MDKGIKSSNKWIGFDLDGTIADNSAHTYGMGRIGKPIVKTCELMRKFHKMGWDVRIFTARLSDVGQDLHSQDRVKNHIWEWCDEALGFRPPITDRKDYLMECLYDDRAIQVVRNDGTTYFELLARMTELMGQISRMVERPNEKLITVEGAIELSKRCRKAYEDGKRMLDSLNTI